MYVSNLSCALSGDLDVTAFKQAWQRVVDRHAVLRTMFVWEGQSKPLQVVRQQVDSPWVEHDWRHYSAAEQQERLKIYLETDRERGFDFLHAPLLRLTLIRMGEDSYHFIWSHHHLLMDGWSAMTITQEVFAFTKPSRAARSYSCRTPSAIVTTSHGCASRILKRRKASGGKHSQALQSQHPPAD